MTNMATVGVATSSADNVRQNPHNQGLPPLCLRLAPGVVRRKPLTFTSIGGYIMADIPQSMTVCTPCPFPTPRLATPNQEQSSTRLLMAKGCSFTSPHPAANTGD